MQTTQLVVVAHSILLLLFGGAFVFLVVHVMFVNSKMFRVLLIASFDILTCVQLRKTSLSDYQ